MQRLGSKKDANCETTGKFCAAALTCRGDSPLLFSVFRSCALNGFLHLNDWAWDFSNHAERPEQAAYARVCGVGSFLLLPTALSSSAQELDDGRTYTSKRS